MGASADVRQEEAESDEQAELDATDDTIQKEGERVREESDTSGATEGRSNEEVEAEEPLLPSTDQKLLPKADSTEVSLWEQVKKTYHLNDLPEYLIDNEFIHNGYRVDLSVKQALLSIFTIHNETGNVWTHLLGFLLFFCLTIYTVIHWPQGVDLPALSSLPKLRSLAGVELPSLSSLQAALPHLQLPESLLSCFHTADAEEASGKDAQQCIFAMVRHLQLPESLSSCFHSASVAASDAERCIFAALPHLQLPEALSSCFHSTDAAAASGKEADQCMFVALWIYLQAAFPHLQLPESLSSCFHSYDAPVAAGKDTEQCMFQTLSDDAIKLVAPYLRQQSELQPPITRWPFLLFLFGAMVCLFTSSTCHLLGCHSKEFNSILWRFDYAGIATLIATSFYPSVYYAFLCDPITRSIYLVTITVLGIALIMVSLLDEFQQSDYRHFRAGLFFGIGASGVIPTAHKVLFYWRHPVVVITTVYEVSMGVLYGLGAFFYASRIPERWLPGKFDIAGHSHQIFHVLVIAGALVHYATGLEYLKWRDVDACPGSLP